MASSGAGADGPLALRNGDAESCDPAYPECYEIWARITDPDIPPILSEKQFYQGPDRPHFPTIGHTGATEGMNVEADLVWAKPAAGGGWNIIGFPTKTATPIHVGGRLRYMQLTDWNADGKDELFYVVEIYDTDGNPARIEYWAATSSRPRSARLTAPVETAATPKVFRRALNTTPIQPTGTTTTRGPSVTWRATVSRIPCSPLSRTGQSVLGAQVFHGTKPYAYNQWFTGDVLHTHDAAGDDEEHLIRAVDWDGSGNDAVVLVHENADRERLPDKTLPVQPRRGCIQLELRDDQNGGNTDTPQAIDAGLVKDNDALARTLVTMHPIYDIHGESIWSWKSKGSRLSVLPAERSEMAEARRLVGRRIHAGARLPRHRSGPHAPGMHAEGHGLTGPSSS